MGGGLHFGARAVVVVAQDARPTGAGANVAVVVVAQDARPTAVGPMSRWLMSRKMRDLPQDANYPKR